MALRLLVAGGVPGPLRGRTQSGRVSPARSGAQTSNDTRFLRRSWEVNLSEIEIVARWEQRTLPRRWAPYVTGAKGLRWIDPLSTIIDWSNAGLLVRVFNEHLYGSHSRTIKNENFYWVPGVAFSTIGNDFGARLHRSEQSLERRAHQFFLKARMIASAYCAYSTPH